MITFIEGPAADIDLMLGRAPIMLKVVHNKTTDKWDALDQLADVPADDEEIYVYRMEGRATFVHIDYTEKGRRCGRTVWHGKYRFVTDQPTDEEIRRTDAWWKWCEANYERYKHAPVESVGGAA